MFWGGPCPPLYIRGDRVTWKVLAEYSWSPTTTQSGSFLYTAASSTPIRVVTREVRYIHELSLTLEHSIPISSPAARVWQAPEVFVAESCRRRVFGWRLRVLQVVKTLFWLHLILPSDTSSCPPSTSICSEVVRCSSPEILIIYGARSTRAPYGVAPEP